MCNSFGISSKFIFDLDVLFAMSRTGFDDGISEKINSLGKSFKPDPANLQKAHPEKEQRCEPLFDENLSSSELNLKNEIIDELKKQEVIVLRYGMLENYFDKSNDIVKDGKEAQKEAELKAIFSA